MTADITFHFPPELFNLLVDTIPLLNRSKKDVLTFFRGAGVPDEITGDLTKKLKAAPSEIHKFDIVRIVIEGLNARGEMMLKQRREVLRRVIEFENFDTCWPADQLKAKGLVASIREVVSKKDAFTRINLEREQERQARLAQAEQANRAKQERAARIEVAKNEFYALFSSGVTRQARGKK